MNKAGARPELRLYGEVSPFDISAAAFADALAAIDAPELDVRINSPGGSVFEGIGIHNAIARHRAKTTVHIDGLAGSAASFIAMAGDEIVVNRYAHVMVHDAAGLLLGTADDATAFADVLNRLSDTIASVYADRAGGTVEQWRDIMRREHWFTADEAVAAGLADRIEGGPTRTAKRSAPAGRNTSPAVALAVATARRRRTQRLGV